MMAGALTLAVSPGGLSSGNHRQEYEAARSRARPDYVYARLELERATKLPHCGVVRSHERLPGEAKRLELASTGVGFRYNLGGNFVLRADYGWQLKDSGVSDGRRNQRGHLSAVLAY